MRQAARGQQCQVRLPGVCSFDSDTVVLAHLRRGGVAGVGQKPNDLIGVYACDKCHSAIDGRVQVDAGLKPVMDRYILDGLCRTLDQVVKQGIVKA